VIGREAPAPARPTTCAYIERDGTVLHGDHRESAVGWTGPLLSLADVDRAGFARDMNPEVWRAASTAFLEHCARAVYIAVEPSQLPSGEAGGS
jgi:hypothetical protein